MTKFTIEVYSDPVCPWCYIGKENLDRAMRVYREEHADAEFEVVWKPFYLAKGLADSDRKQVYTRRLGHRRATQLIDNATAQAAALGIPLKWTGRTGDSAASHRLLRLARDRDMANRGPTSASSSFSSTTNTTATPHSSLPLPPPEETFQDKILTVLFHGQFAEGRSIAEAALLVEAAVRSGLADTEEEARAWLDLEDGNEDGDENHDDGGDDGEGPGRLQELRASVDAEARAAVDAYGISAVPSYVVQGRFRVGGCQGPEVFLALFERIRTTAVAVTAAAAAAEEEGGDEM